MDEGPDVGSPAAPAGEVERAEGRAASPSSRPSAAEFTNQIPESEGIGAAEDRREAPVAVAPSLSNSNNCNEAGGEINKLTGGHLRTAFVLTHEIQRLAVEFGVERLGFLTLTFKKPVFDIRKAQRRFHSLNTGVLKDRYQRVVTVVERHQSGAVHYHLVVALGADIRSGCDFEAIGRGDYQSANQALRSEWSFWRRTCEGYGFGRHELMPVKSTADGIARYVGKYVSKHIQLREEADKGARLVRFTGYGPGDRKGSTRFAWNNAGGWLWRSKLKAFAAQVGAKTTDDLKRLFGPRWAYFLQPLILSCVSGERLPSQEAVEMDRNWLGRRAVLEANARDSMAKMTFKKTYALNPSG